MEHLQHFGRHAFTGSVPRLFLNGRWFRLACLASRKGWIDYSDWRGTRKELLRERLILQDVEREIEVESIDRILSARTKEAFDLADFANAIRAPWLSAAENEKTIRQELDQLLEDNK